MKIYYMSDLHKDINGDYIEKLKIPDDAEESILLLAGDLHSKGRCATVADYFADFYKYAFVGLMLEWIRKDMKEDPAIIVERLSRTIQGSISLALERYRTDL